MKLTEINASFEIPAQNWIFQDNARTVKVYVRYPSAKLSSINSKTGLMLSIHNWGGTDYEGSVEPQTFADKYNLIVISMDYLQSGEWNPEKGIPYDSGYLQAMDALRSLYFVYNELSMQHISFDHGRVYAAGGSGGGTIALMVNKFAPRTFACVIDICGLAKLSDEIAFGDPNQVCNAGYSRDPNSAAYLAPDQQEIRFVGNPAHLKIMKMLGNSCKVCVIHGATDYASPIEYAIEMIRYFKQSEIDIEAHIISDHDIDGIIFTETGHSVGNRTLAAEKFAEKYLDQTSCSLLRRSSPNDFDLRDDNVRYPTENGLFLISYRDGYPMIEFQQNKTNSVI